MRLGRRLGRKAIKTDTRTPRMARYTAGLPAPPPSRDWTRGVTAWGMLDNDTLGDCTIAGCAHLVDLWTLNTTGTMATITDADALAYYEKWCGYNPTNPATDQGGVELDVLTDWRKSGFAGHKILGFASIHPGDLTTARQAINLFGAVYLGINMPLSAQYQKAWEVVPDEGTGDTEPGSWGGHCVIAPRYDANFGVITWGQNMPMTENFWKKYVDEVWVVLGADWVNAMDSPSGFDMAQLQADLNEIT
jgi:hypothetical protein